MVGIGLVGMLLSSSTSWAAAPAVVPVTGFVSDSGGVPIDGDVEIRVRLYATASAGASLFDETQTVPADQGQFTVYLNAEAQQSGFLDLFADQSTLFLGLSVEGGTEMSPRFELGTAPWAAYAQHAGDARTLDGRTADDFRAASDPVGWTDLSGVPASLADGDQDTTYTAGAGLDLAGGQFAVQQAAVEGWARGVAYDTPAELAAALSGEYLPDISCPDKQFPAFDGSGWYCFDPRPTALDASVITSGTVGIGRLPTGTSGTAVALGNHAHDFTSITGSLDASRLTGGVAVGNDAATCDTTKAGTLRWTGTALQLCANGSWTPIFMAMNGSQTAPSRSCAQLHTDFPGFPSGAYWVDPNGGSTTDAKQVYCDMTTRGGGWTRVAVMSGTVAVCSMADAYGTEANVATGTGDAWYDDAWIAPMFVQKELLVSTSGNYHTLTSTNTNWTWPNIAGGTFNTANAGTYGLRGAWGEAALGNLSQSGNGCNQASGCLGGIQTTAGWTPIIGIGSYARGTFTQDSSCQSMSGTYTGMYSGVNGSPSGSWQRSGSVWVR